MTGSKAFRYPWSRTGAGPLILKIVDGSLCIKSTRVASCYLGEAAPQLVDADGFVDTGDLVERRGDRYLFVGRRGGIINVGGMKVNPEEVEAALNSHRDVRMSLVRGAQEPADRRARRRRYRAARLRDRDR